MPDLFGEPLIDGLEVRHELVRADEESRLIGLCRNLALEPFRFQGWEGKRLTRSFGWSYDFDRGRIADAEPLPDWLALVRQAAARAFGREPERFEQAMVIRYDPGAGIGWHRDRPQFDEVIGVSLGMPTVMAFRRRKPDRRFERVKLLLEPRSAYLLSGEARNGWQHGISAHDGLRFSLTFRSLR